MSSLASSSMSGRLRNGSGSTCTKRGKRKMKTTLDSISFKQYMAHEWPVKDAVDKGLFGGKAAEQNKRCSRSRAVLISALTQSTFPFGRVSRRAAGSAILPCFWSRKTLVSISATTAPSRSALRSQAAAGDPGSAAASDTDDDSDVATSLYSSPPKASRTSRMNSWNALNRARSRSGMASRISRCPESNSFTRVIWAHSSSFSSPPRSSSPLLWRSMFSPRKSIRSAPWRSAVLRYELS